MTSHVRGREAELIFAARCLALGVIHLEPTTTGLPYDALIQLVSTGPFKRVQVKRAFRRRGGPGKEFTGSRYVVTLKRSGDKAYVEDDADYLAIVVDHEFMYLIPWAQAVQHREITVTNMSDHLLTEKWTHAHRIDY